MHVLLYIDANVPIKQEVDLNQVRIGKILDKVTKPQCISIPEGGFVYFSHPIVGAWLKKTFDVETIKDIRAKLSPHLQIPLTQTGFTAASTRRDEAELDPTNYSAIWVRDSCWHYFGLKIDNPIAAKRLILSLLNFYSTKEQISRFLSVIQDPNVANPSSNPKAHMDVPLVRFSGKTLSHHQIDGKNQEWNHIQFDSHGLFLLALSDALQNKILTKEDLTEPYFEVLTLFPAFFTAVQYAQKKDAGPWEEECIYNASSAGLVASGQKRIMEVINNHPNLKRDLEMALSNMRKKYNSIVMNKILSALSDQNIEKLYQEGLKRVEQNLSLGGESPNLDGKGVDRSADAALLFLCLLEHTPYHNNPEKMKQILNINLSLIGPYGIYRYKYDPYQAANYWIEYNVPSTILGTQTETLSSVERFHKGYKPNRQALDAQWFFDSNFAEIYYHLSLIEKDRNVKSYYLKKGDIHLKRSLAQFTGPDAYAANGEKLNPWQLPESINTVIDQKNNITPMPSPISPLSWAISAMQMALEKSQVAHEDVEKEKIATSALSEQPLMTAHSH